MTNDRDRAGWNSGEIYRDRDQRDVIDRVFAVAFDVLGLQTVERPIRPAEGDTLPGSPKNDS